ncbi:MAG TPA: hypothetical protein VNI77_09600 [Nitrososphaera sp.]|nr:hypothetical protein [Nitrososphaera sp.]
MDHAMPMSNDTATIDMSNATSANATTTVGVTIVDMAAYRNTAYLANSSIMIFNDNLRPLTTPIANATGDNATAANIERLETSLIQLRDEIQNLQARMTRWNRHILVYILC